MRAFLVESRQLLLSAFRVAIRGIDFEDNVIQRYDATLIKPAVTQITANVTSLSQLPGSSVDVEINITSSVSLSSWNVYVTDSGNFYSGPPSLVYV